MIWIPFRSKRVTFIILNRILLWKECLTKPVELYIYTIFLLTKKHKFILKHHLAGKLLNTTKAESDGTGRRSLAYLLARKWFVYTFTHTHIYISCVCKYIYHTILSAQTSSYTPNDKLPACTNTHTQIQIPFRTGMSGLPGINTIALSERNACSGRLSSGQIVSRPAVHHLEHCTRSQTIKP